VGSDAPGDLALSLDLVSRIRDGDRSAWESLYLRYRDALLFSIRCRLGAGLRSRLQSEDILHSVVKDALEDLHRRPFEPRGENSLAHYLHACVLNKIRAKADYFGAARREGDVPLTDSILERLPNARGSEPRYIDSERYEKLEKALGLLPEDMREAILLRRVEGLSNTEAAAVLGKSPEAASKLYNRALARLGGLLGAG
jgi:RNA polymerase sigma-70 factor (ECF subfamily)